MSEPLGAGAGAMAQAQTKATVDNAGDLGLIWTRRLASVTGYSGTVPMALMDGDTVPIAVVSMVGSLAAGQRVYVDIVPPSGKYVVGVVSGQIGARARVTNAQNVNNAAQTTLAWNQVDERSGATFVATGGTTWTIPYDGLWAITLVAVMSGVGGTRNFAAINVTSTVTGAATIYRASWDPGEDRTNVGIVIPMRRGDTFNASVFQNSGGAQTVAASLTLYRVGGFTP